MTPIRADKALNYRRRARKSIFEGVLDLKSGDSCIFRGSLKPHPSLIRIDDIKDQRTQRQSAILEWANATFGEATASNKGERIRRFAEEAIEMAQAVGLDKQALHGIIDHVYAKPAGNVAQEIGQVGVSLLALAEHLGISAEEEEFKEFDRITSLPSGYWQARQNAKADKGLALPTSTM